jgi:hypothetical protein
MTDIYHLALTRRKTQLIRHDSDDDNIEWLIYLAAKDFSHIVCPDMSQVNIIWKRVHGLKMTRYVPQPITWESFIRGYYHAPGVTGFLISNLDQCLRSMTSVPVLAATWKEDWEETS